MTAPLRTLIVDDEPMAIERLQLLLSANEDVRLIGTAASGESALRLIESVDADLVLLDIAMPGLNGLDLAEVLADRDRAPAVIFITAYNQHAVRAFDLAATDYLLKPVERGRLERAVARARARLGTAAPVSPWLTELWVPYRGDMLRVPVEDIAHIEAERDYMRIHAGEHSYLLHATMGSLEERLDPQMFIRTHRSHIFRRDTIRRLHHDAMGAWSVEDDRGGRARIGRTYLKAVKALLAN